MIYTSTRIKKKAAEAYAREEIETQTYSFTKPEGLICPSGQLGPETAFVRSESYGDTEATETTLQAEGMLTVHQKPLSRILEDLKASSQTTDTSAFPDSLVVVRQIKEGDVEFTEFHKLIEGRPGRTFEFKVKVVKDYLEQFGEKARGMVESFQLKS